MFTLRPPHRLRLSTSLIIHLHTLQTYTHTYPILRVLSFLFTMKAVLTSGWALALLGAFQSVTAQEKYKVQTPPLTTDWTYKVGTNPWPEHPRPQLRRDAWKSLNGLWTWRRAAGTGDANTLPASGPLDKEVLVPACIESALSGLQILDARYMWYETTFEVPKDWKKQSVLLNFEAVDNTAVVYVNGVKQGTHVGGYDRYTVDITKDVKIGEKNELYVLPPFTTWHWDSC